MKPLLSTIYYVYIHVLSCSPYCLYHIFSIYYLYCISLRFWSTLITMPYYARPQWNQSSGLNFEDCGLAKNLRKSRFEPYAPRAFWIERLALGALLRGVTFLHLRCDIKHPWLSQATAVVPCTCIAFFHLQSQCHAT